jgi:hypothetical protein
MENGRARQVIKLLRLRRKEDTVSFAVQFSNSKAVNRDRMTGLIEANSWRGFLRLQRNAIERMIAAYPGFDTRHPPLREKRRIGTLFSIRALRTESFTVKTIPSATDGAPLMGRFGSTRTSRSARRHDDVHRFAWRSFGQKVTNDCSGIKARID